MRAAALCHSLQVDGVPADAEQVRLTGPQHLKSNRGGQQVAQSPHSRAVLFACMLHSSTTVVQLKGNKAQDCWIGCGTGG